MPPELAWLAGLGAGVVITAALANRLSPTQRVQRRRLVLLFVLYALLYATARLVAEIEPGVWAVRVEIAAELLRALTLVNVIGTLVFSVLLRVVGLSLPTIASDLLIGLGYVLATVGVLSQHGLDPTGALATGAVVSAVLAISLQQTLGNILGGVALQLDGSIHEGDWIQLENGKQGKIRAIRWRHTLVETRDWSTIVVPNAQLLANNITILGWRDGQSTPQRMWVWFNVDFRYPPTRVIEVVTEALLGSPIENVASDPKPSCVCMDFAKDGRDSYACYAVRYWLLDLAPDDPTNSRVRARIYAALKRAGIPLAVPAHANLVQMHDEQHKERHTENETLARLTALKTVHLFREMTESELRTLADGMSVVIYCGGETITRQGAVAHWLYIMTRGTAEVRAKIDPDGDGPAPALTRVVAKLTAPDFFGEMGLMTGEPRLADVVATSDVECFRLGKETVERVLLARPAIAEEMSAKLAQRRVELAAVREGLDDEARRAREITESARILGGIKRFFGI